MRLYVDLSEVSFIDPCALLHLAAQLDHARARMRVSGNYPLAEAARAALRDARFERFMGSQERLRPVPGAIPDIELRRGDRSTGLRPRDWAPLHQFIKAHGSLTDDEADGFYSAFGECVENVIQHAYRGRRGRWFALAFRPGERPARAVILDLGIGIPRSVRRKPGDWIHMGLGLVLQKLREAWTLDDPEDRGEDEDDDLDVVSELLRRIESFDWNCVHLATLGKRTETGEPKRGKGLSELRKAVLEQGRGALHVLSGRAAVTWSADVEPTAANLTPLRGTVVCLELGLPRAAGAKSDA
jgi:hypothetical protein